MREPVGVGAPVEIRVPEGASLPQIAEMLHAHGLIRHPAVFLWTALARGAERTLQAGRYRFSPAEDVDTIVRRIAAGEVVSVAFVIPEGYTAEQIVATVAAAGIGDEERLRSVFRNADRSIVVPQMRGNASGFLEGYLFPDTYRISPDARDEDVARRMVGRFAAAAGPLLEGRLPLGLSPHAIVTIASMVEREARVATERPVIAGVIYNRLRRGMRLEIDATVLYALGRHKAVVRNRDLEIDSAFNTYRVSGLPPGPIASPGLPAIEAAVRPATHDFLYYVARDDGSHVFTRTFDDHLRAIRDVRGER